MWLISKVKSGASAVGGGLVKGAAVVGGGLVKGAATVGGGLVKGAVAVKDGVVSAPGKAVAVVAAIGGATAAVAGTAVTVGKMMAREVVDPVATTEIQEVLDAAFEALAVARRVGSDGWQFSDVGLVITDKKLMDAVKRALSGAGKIPTELSNLSFSETLGFVMSSVNSLKKLGK
jgi:hypothetical protein